MPNKCSQNASPVEAALQACLIAGGPGTGKTTRLMARVQQLIESGVSSADILVLSATPDGSDSFRNQLQDLCGMGSLGSCVSTPREMQMHILNMPQAFRIVGRSPRVLSSFEESFFFEDMKMSGMKPRRLREMLKFFYRSLTELADDNPDWLLGTEEEETARLMRSCLAYMDGILEYEIASLAVKVLRSDESIRQAFTRKHVLVDDYQLDQRASQVMANMLASESIWIAADIDGCTQAFEPYPYRKGVAEFIEANPDVQVNKLKASSHATLLISALNRLRVDSAIDAEPLDQAPDAPTGELLTCASPNLKAEVDAVVEQVASWLEQGEKSERIFLATPRRVWESNLKQALDDNGIACVTMPGPRALSGDVRDLDSCKAARIYTVLSLVANPNDCVSWRCWCGFGDWLTRSTLMRKLRESAGNGTQTLLNDIRALAQDGSESPLAQAYRNGMELLETVKDLEGDSLLRAITEALYGKGERVPSAIRQLSAPFGDDLEASQDARALCNRIRKRILLPGAYGQEGVRIGSMNNALGSQTDTLVLMGFLNGIFPAHVYFDATKLTLEKEERMRRHDVRRMYAIAGVPKKRLACTYFENASIFEAETLDLKIARIFLMNKKRRAKTEPSIFISMMQSQNRDSS